MTANDFKAAQKRLGLMNWQMANAIGCSLSSITKYRAGDVSVPSQVAKLVNLLLAAKDVETKLRRESKRLGVDSLERLAECLSEASGLPV